MQQAVIRFGESQHELGALGAFSTVRALGRHNISPDNVEVGEVEILLNPVKVSHV